MPIRLDQRLSAIAALVDHGIVADIGCDHGKLGYYLLGTDRAAAVIATDISADSLSKARELAFDNGVSDLMDTRLGDGLEPLRDGEADTVVIAGLGGDVISEILAGANADGKSFGHFVLSPNTHPEKVRKELLKCGHKIIVDDEVECAGKRYTLIKTERGEDCLDDMQILYGKFFETSEKFVRRARGELAYMRGLLVKNPDSRELADKVRMLESALSRTKGNENEDK